jgi:4-amino-4-deoxy-L-arabinose transferase-like glycosyltransferase
VSTALELGAGRSRLRELGALVAAGWARWGAAVAPVCVLALAAALRLALLDRTPLDPFYDAAVRSMGGSWHAFFTGAIDPAASVAIDKAPVDLWLQVATTKLLGFTPLALLLPAAIGGTLAVAALYDLVRTLAGRSAALLAALALAVLPLAVISARSDTMDSVMAALLLTAYAVAARGMRSGRRSQMIIAGVLVGLAFEVKLFEALVALAPLALMWWLGAPGSRARRAATLATAGGAFVVVALAWLVALTLFVPASQRPWAFGATNGSAWNATFIYDGWDRLTGANPPPEPAPVPLRGRLTAARRARLAAAQRRSNAIRAYAHAQAPARPGPLRLLSARAHLGARVGIELAAAWLALALVVALGAWRRLDRGGRAGLAALAAWLALGTLLFSAQAALRPRYLEAFDGAVAGCLGLAAWLTTAALLQRWPGRRRAPAIRAVAALALGAVLAPALATSVAAARAHTQDSGSPGALAPARLTALSHYLRAHRHGARYEVASVAVAKAGALIAYDGAQTLLLNGAYGHPLVSTARLASLVAHGQLHSAIVGSTCTAATLDRWDGCSPAARWIRAHGTDVSRVSGQPHLGLVYALHSAPNHLGRVVPAERAQVGPRHHPGRAHGR